MFVWCSNGILLHTQYTLLVLTNTINSAIVSIVQIYYNNYDSGCHPVTIMPKVKLAKQGIEFSLVEGIAEYKYPIL